MYLNQINLKLQEMLEYRKIHDCKKMNLSELRSLPYFNGVLELEFLNKKFLMLNILNDDAVPLKYFWRQGYELLSLRIWYALTRSENSFFDVGAHTGIFSIIGNLNKQSNNIVSIEPFHLNFERLLSNLKLNNIFPNCIMGACSSNDGIMNFEFNSFGGYHTSGGKVSEKKGTIIKVHKIDSINTNKPVEALKIDTEGHELEVLIGAENTIKNHTPEIIFEINIESFDKCRKFLSNFNYQFYFIDEVSNKILDLKGDIKNFIRTEGSNCLATTKFGLNEINNLIV